MTEYSETVAPDDDPEGTVLEALAKGMPYAFVVAANLDPLDLKLSTGNDLETVRALLEKTLQALPGTPE